MVSLLLGMNYKRGRRGIYKEPMKDFRRSKNQSSINKSS